MTMQKTKRIDHGYAWVILGSCFVLSFLLNGFWSVVGMLMIKWEASFDVSASETATIATLFVVLAYGTCIGMGVIFHTSASYYVPYFNKRFGLANGLLNVAPAVGVVIFPPLMRESFTFFGFNGTLQVMAAAMAHICVCGALLRPENYIKPQKRRPERTQNCEEDAKNYEKIENSNCPLLTDVAKSFDLALFRSVRFISQTIINGILYGGFATPLIYIVPYAESVGITDIKSPLLMSIVAGCSIVVRLIPVGHLLDKRVISAASLTIAGSALSSCAIILFAFIKNFLGLAILAGLYGIGWGVGSTFLAVIVAYSGGSKETSSGAIAWTLLGRGLGSFVCIYGGGVLRDKFNSYQPSLILCGVFGLCLALNVLSYTLLERWKLRQRSITYDGKSAGHNFSSIPDVAASSAE